MLQKFLKIIFLVFFININIYASSWLQQTMQFQRDIDLDVPLNEATFLGTHNSYNSKAYQIPAVRYVDPNQKLSLYDQLEAGVRSLELDAHWSFKQNLSKEILLCHAQANHLGCSIYDRPFKDGLKEIGEWVKIHPQEIILLYIERHLDNHESRMSAQLEEILGPYILKTDTFRINNSACVALPTHLTKNDILKMGKQILVVTKNCNGPNSFSNSNEKNINWHNYVFTGIGTIPTLPYTFIDMTIANFNKHPDCHKDTAFEKDYFHNSIWRVYEDRTQLGGIIHPSRKLLFDDMLELIKCGINWPTVDFLQHEDDRLKAAIWSWSLAYPQVNFGRCAFYEKDSGIKNNHCNQFLPAFACKQEKTHRLKLSVLPGTWQFGENACQQLGLDWHFSLPQNGQQAYLLQNLMLLKNISQVWLNYAMNKSNHWQHHYQSRKING